MSYRFINVIETTLSSAPTAIFMFHSTPVMNYLTWNAIICPYPLFVNGGQALINEYRARFPPKLAEALLKYIKRGYNYMKSASEWKEDHKCGEDPYCGKTVRYICDRWTLRFTFCPISQVADTVDPYIEWKLAGRIDCRGKTWRPYSGFVKSNGNKCLCECAPLPVVDADPNTPHRQEPLVLAQVGGVDVSNTESWTTCHIQ